MRDLTTCLKIKMTFFVNNNALAPEVFGGLSLQFPTFSGILTLEPLLAYIFRNFSEFS